MSPQSDVERVKCLFRWESEDSPGPRWSDLFERTWPAYRRWFRSRGENTRPSRRECRNALERHMPELVPVWLQLLELSEGGDEVACMLSLFRPPAYLAGCSQAVWSRGVPALVRNYDYNPAWCEATFLRSRWSDTTVLAASDCLWGVLDGVNEHGLTVALAFGGKADIGDGFGIPIILRYVLETCATIDQAVAVLQRVPSHMAYTVSLLDANGRHCAVFVGPGREAEVVDRSVVTNHQRAVTWERYEKRSRSLPRAKFLAAELEDPRHDAGSFAALFLAPPLYQTDFGGGFGTIYTVTYAPGTGTATYRWPDAEVTQSLTAFEERELVVPLGAG